MQSDERNFVVIGGGPAGLTAAYELTKRNFRPIVFEKLDKVGGIARTENYKGYYFDMGGHRFFTKSKYVNDFWRQVLGDDFLLRPRLSRIYYNNTFFNYPLKPFNALRGLGLLQSILVVASYARWQLFPYPEENSFEQWVTNRFGKRLFQTFFEAYTEKVWGIPCSELGADWAAQRIKELSLRTAIFGMFIKRGKSIKTLIEEFEYPRRGPGMLWTAVKDLINEHGGRVQLNNEIVGVQRAGNRVTAVVVNCNGHTETIPGTDFISSMPVTVLLKQLDPPPPDEVLAAADALTYRDFLTVCLIVDRKDLFSDNWIYVHDPAVKVGRIQNFKNWSQDMVPNHEKTSLGLEYFCNEGDELWTMADEDLIELGKCEIDKIGLARYQDVEDGVVYRVEKSYPVYDSSYRQHLETIKSYLSNLENFQTIGRNGLHRYNNQDHAMLTGMLAVRNLLYREKNDLWQVNAEEEYHEEIVIDDDITKDEVLGVVRDSIVHIFPKLDPVAFALALGAVAAAGLFAATMILVLRGDEVVGPHLGLLSQFLYGYTVTPVGSLIGLLYAFIIGSIVGWGVAFLRNAVTLLYLAGMVRSTERTVLSTILEHI